MRLFLRIILTTGLWCLVPEYRQYYAGLISPKKRQYYSKRIAGIVRLGLVATPRPIILFRPQYYSIPQFPQYFSIIPEKFSEMLASNAYTNWIIYLITGIILRQHRF